VISGFRFLKGQAQSEGEGACPKRLGLEVSSKRNRKAPQITPVARLLFELAVKDFTCDG